MFEKLWKWLKVALIAATVATSAAFPSIALAYDGGYVPGAGGSYSSGYSKNAADRLAWVIGNSDWGTDMNNFLYRSGSLLNSAVYYGDYYIEDWGPYKAESLASYIKRMNGVDDSYISKIFLAAYTGTNNYNNIVDNTIAHYDYRPFIWDQSYCNFLNNNNWNRDSYFYKLPALLRDGSVTGLWANYSTGTHYATDGSGSPVVAVFVRPELMLVPKTNVTERTVITYNSDGGYNLPGDTQEALKYLFENGKTEDTYEHTTAAGDTSESHTVKVRTAVVYKIETWNENTNTHEVRDYNVSYRLGQVTDYKKTIKYTTQTPTITQDKYTPFNLNRNGYATSADISSDYANASLKLDGTVDNNQNITDGSALNALDNNSDTKFTFKFNNSVFGLSALYDWNSQPAALANGTYELVNHSLGYANGKVSSNSDEAYRYNLKLYMSLSTNRKNSSISSSSLLFGSDEITSDSSMVKSATGGSTFTGGDFSSRFTYADTYTTDNGVSGSKFGNWWITTYDEAKLYEYGTHYSGKITAQDGIYDPDSIDYGTGSSDGSNYKITINTDNKQRGLYVGETIASFEQPVLIGTWNVKTLAGDLN